MANGHSIIPIDNSKMANDSVDYVEDYWPLYAVDTLPDGRYPTLVELRNVIEQSGYELETAGDWYVTSERDRTEIWFSDGQREAHTPHNIWFRRGSRIVLDIVQNLANQCGSMLLVDHSGAIAVLIVPDHVFGIKVEAQAQRDFFPVMAERIPLIVARLNDLLSEVEQVLFLLSQVRQALIIEAEFKEYKLQYIASQSSDTFIRYLTHSDHRVRFMAFDLIARSRSTFYFNAEALASAIKTESNIHSQIRMIWSVSHRIIGDYTNRNGEKTQKVLDILFGLSDDETIAKPVRLAASHLLARTKPGYLNDTIRTIFIDALIHPEQYHHTEGSLWSINRETLNSIDHLMLHNRIDILTEALPDILYAQDAHEALVSLLDNVFFGAREKQGTWRSSLLDTHDAERPSVGDTKFHDNLSRNLLYPANLTGVAIDELLPFQRRVLVMVIEIDTPWMVHSNLLQKYGLPATRAEVRQMLKDHGEYRGK